MWNNNEAMNFNLQIWDGSPEGIGRQVPVTISPAAPIVLEVGESIVLEDHFVAFGDVTNTAISAINEGDVTAAIATTTVNADGNVVLTANGIGSVMLAINHNDYQTEPNYSMVQIDVVEVAPVEETPTEETPVEDTTEETPDTTNEDQTNNNQTNTPSSQSVTHHVEADFTSTETKLIEAVEGDTIKFVIPEQSSTQTFQVVEHENNANNTYNRQLANNQTRTQIGGATTAPDNSNFRQDSSDIETVQIDMDATTTQQIYVDAYDAVRLQVINGTPNYEMYSNGGDYIPLVPDTLQTASVQSTQ